MRSHSGSSNSKASSISKKREEMALVRLKVEQLRIRQQFEIQEQEIKRNKTPAQAFTLPSEIMELRNLFRLFSNTGAGWVWFSGAL